MTSYVPEPPEVLAQAWATQALPPEPTPAPACVDCAAQGDLVPLTTVYTVAGTVLCQDHAVAARAGATK